MTIPELTEMVAELRDYDLRAMTRNALAPLLACADALARIAERPCVGADMAKIYGEAPPEDCHCVVHQARAAIERLR